MDEPFIHPTACVDQPCEIGAGTKVWHFCHVMPGARIGRGCVLGQNVFVGADVVVGDGVKIQNNVSVYTGVTLEDEVFVGPSVVFTNVKSPRADVVRNTEAGRAKTLVKKGATIGANATLIGGVTVGRHGFVGAGSLVNRDVPDQALVVGNPARQLGWVCLCGERLSPSDEEGKTLSCAGCGRTFEEKWDGLAAPD